MDYHLEPRSPGLKVTPPAQRPRCTSRGLKPAECKHREDDHEEEEEEEEKEVDGRIMVGTGMEVESCFAGRCCFLA